MSLSSGAIAYKLAYEIGPISLVGGSASLVPGGALSIISFLQSMDFAGLLGEGDIEIDDTMANYMPLPGGTLIENAIGTYPFANIETAANCTIAQPLQIALAMRIPARRPGGYAEKGYILSSLAQTLKQHIQSGGTFMVNTPANPYTNCLLTRLTDISAGETLQTQVTFRWDFIKPLITQEDAASSQNAMMSLLSSGGATDGALSGVALTLGQPGTLATALISPAAQSAPASGIAAGLSGFFGG